MLQRICVAGLLSASILTLQVVYPAKSEDSPIIGNRKTVLQPISDIQENNSGRQPTTNSPRLIFLPPDQNNISDICTSTTPWLSPALKPIVQKFTNVVLKALRTSPIASKVWNMKTDSDTTRKIFFKLGNIFFWKYGHPTPAAFANIISKSASLFNSISHPVYYKAVAISLAEFFLSEKVKVDRKLAMLYVSHIEDRLKLADLNDVESIWQADLDGYANFFLSLRYEIREISDKAFELFASQLIVLHDVTKT